MTRVRIGISTRYVEASHLTAIAAGALVNVFRLRVIPLQVKQAQTYDSDGSYIRYWCPELKDVPTNILHQPWLLTAEARRQYRVGNYPMPIVRVKAPSGGGGGKGGGGGAKGGGGKGNSNRNGGQYKQARR